ncbi:MAG: MetQ/NlpA family ABC transporter substrate-binding protein [Elusimicrobiota bacterium]|nr:MetQ/NlpA family ABC transporter substrate-binding protein [Elusimicrobiota bacterium]
MKKISIAVLALAVGIAGIAAFSSCAKKTDEIVVKVGIVGDNNPQWEVIKKNLAKEGIKIELVKFGDYVLPNQALASGEIDLNAFQHYAYLNNEIKTKGYKITAIGKTIIAPIGLYSKKIKSISELKKGDTIAIPNDVVNGGRALLVLQVAGLIKVHPKGGYLPNVSDITSNPLDLKFIQVEAAQTPRLLDDVTAAFINGGHAVDAGLNPERDSLLLEKQEEGQDNPYINIIAARTEDKDNPIYKKIVDAYHTDEVKAVILKDFKGAYQPAW